MKSLIQFFIRQHLFGNVITGLVIIFGIFSIFVIRKDLFPQVTFDTTLVVAVLPGASPDQVEKLLVNPIEEALREVDGIKKVQSSASDSRAVVTVILDPDSRKPEKTNDDIRRAVDQIDDYPTDAEKPIVTELESGQTPVIELTINSSSMNEIELREWVRSIADELSLTSGVAKVTKNAWLKKEQVVELDPSLLRQNSTSISQVIQSLAKSNIQLPGGDFTIKDGFEMAVRTDGEFKSVKDIENTYIRKNFEGFGVQVKDLGKIETRLEKPSVMYRNNGERAFSLTIIKKSKADALDVVKRVKERAETLKEKLPQAIQMQFTNDFTQYLTNRISILSGNLITGIILVFVILALFLPWKIALVVAMGIPFSMLGSIAILNQMGFSLNLISMIGLIIVSGMLVDDAVVVAENVFRRLELGEDFDTAVLEGTKEMLAPVLASVLTTVVAFSPMLFMTGIFGKFIFEIPVMVIIPLLVSVVEAFIIGPSHFKSWVGPKVQQYIIDAKKDQSKIHWYDRLLPYYKSLVVWTINHRKKTALIFTGTIVVTIIAVTQMKFILFPPDGIYTFFIRLDAQPGIQLAEMEKIVQSVEPEILKLPKDELQSFVTQIGLQQNDPNDPFTRRASHYAQIRVNLTPEGQRVRGVNEIVEELRQRIKKPEKALQLQFEIAKGGPPQGKPIAINILGDDFETMKVMANEIKAVLQKIDGVTDLEDSEVVGKNEVKIVPYQDALERFGLSVQDVATTVRAAFSGIVATSTRNLNEEVNIRVQLKPKEAVALSQLTQLDIQTREGNLIPVSRVAKFEESPSRLLVKHEKFKRVITVGGQVDLSKTTAIKVNQQAQKQLQDLTKKYPNYKIEFGGENEDTAESMKSLMKAFLVAFVSIFTILVITFGSFSQPVLVLLAIPLGFVGTIFGLILHGKPISFMAMLGMIALAGVIVNNVIVLIDFYNTNRNQGMEIKDAIIDAATQRLRPIILTSVTTVLGLMPTAYGIGGYDGFVATLALALGWGLFLGSVLSMIFFPSLLASLELFKTRKS